MSIAWFVCPYKRVPPADDPLPARYCAMDDFTVAIRADGGRWTETEVLGDRAIVKVRASDATLALAASEPGFFRLPLEYLTDSLATLSANARNRVRQELLDAGYAVTEFNAAFPDGLENVTLGDALAFLTQRRLKPRYDAAADEIVLDGPPQNVRPLQSVDAEVV